jgi:para-aminobenzoate synthetase component 1
MKPVRILKENAGEDDFYRLLNAFSFLPSIVALWSHTPQSTRQTESYPAHYFESDGWLAASSRQISPSAESSTLSDLRKQITSNRNHLFGFFSYDLKNELENLHSTGSDHFAFPSFWFFEPELLLRFQNRRIECLHASTELYKLSLDILDTPKMEEHGDFRDNPNPGNGSDNCSGSVETKTTRFEKKHGKIGQKDETVCKIEFKPTITRRQYQKNVEIIRRHIRQGDVYELNYCMEWHAHSTKISPVDTWKDMNQRTHAPFSAFVRMNHHYLLSASPERFMCKHGARICSQPIKGTAARHPDAKVDAENARLLADNKKERAENLMIVDLVRNDLSRCCKAGSVKVPQMCKVFSLQTVHQMYSTVCGELQAETHPLDAILAAFPMGSMTGAPKISAMQIIDKLESFKRGLFSGSVGYFTPAGDFDFNVVIRSMLYRSDTKRASVRAGSAITFDSDAQHEWEECLVKAKAIINDDIKDNCG